MKITIIVLTLILMISQYTLWFSTGGMFEAWRLKRTLADQQAENLILAQDNAVLTAEVIDLQQGLEAIEERARSELGMIKQDEAFYQWIKLE